MTSGDNLASVEVGVRDLRNGLSRHLARVRDGVVITVTDHGRAIARLMPLSGERTIDRLVAEGLVTPAATRLRERPRTLKTAHPISDLVAAQRR